MNLLEDYHSFYGLCFNMNNRKLAKQVFDRLPSRVKRLIEKKRVYVCDSMVRYKNPNLKVHGMAAGFYHVGKGIIDIIPQNPPWSDKATLGLIVHETAHAYIDKTFCLLQKAFFKYRFKRLSAQEKEFYPEYQELHANWLAAKWGFAEEIIALDKERVISFSNGLSN